MSLRIRLSRGGAKKRPYYRVVVADSRSPRDGRFIERIGSLNPMVPKDHPQRFTIDEERVKYWLGVGALPTDRLARYLSNAGLVAKPVYSDQPKQSQPKPKTLERMKAREDKLAAAKEAAESAPPAEESAPDDAPAEEAAAEEAPAEEAAPLEAAAEESAPEEAVTDDAPAEEEKKEEA